MKGLKLADDENVSSMGNGWLEGQEQQFLFSTRDLMGARQLCMAYEEL